jgi:ATP-dependent DNA helicase RecQ
VLLYRLEDKRIQNFFLRGRYPRAEEVRAVLDAMRPGAAGEGTEAKPLPLPLTAIAELAGVGVRRTQVILYLLREAGMLRRGRAGYVLRAAGQVRDEQIAELVAEYTDRAARDKERLAEMMHYAQTPGCRTQVLRAYFGEPEGEPCNRCDNCERGLNADADLNEAKPRRRRGAKAAPTATQNGLENEGAAATSANGAGNGTAGVTVVESMHGEIHTTSPETLPHAEPERFAAGDRVRHKSFGLGRIRDVHGNAALVHFPKAGDRRVHTDFLRAAG